MDIQAMENNYNDIRGKTRWASWHLDKSEFINLLDNYDKKVIVNNLRLKYIEELPELELLYIMFRTPHLLKKIYEAIESKLNTERKKANDIYYELLRNWHTHTSASIRAYGGII